MINFFIIINCIIINFKYLNSLPKKFLIIILIKLLFVKVIFFLILINSIIINTF